jgi:hypothetical protein
VARCRLGKCKGWNMVTGYLMVDKLGSAEEFVIGG